MGARRFARVAGVLFLGAAVPGVLSCSLVPKSVGPNDGWAVEVLPPEALDTAEARTGGTPGPGPAPTSAAVDGRPADPGYALHLLTSSAELDYSSTDAFFRSLLKNPEAGSKGVGHCWFILEGPEGSMERGHSGEYGKEQPTYSSGVRWRMLRGHPNPAEYLWTEMRDGRLLEGDQYRDPTFACRVPITRAQHDAIAAYVEAFDPTVFALRGRGCSDFATGAARLARLSIPHRLRITLPRELHLWGRDRVFWTDPAYSVVEFGSPELFERGLRRLVDSGAADPVEL